MNRQVATDVAHKLETDLAEALSRTVGTFRAAGFADVDIAVGTMIAAAAFTARVRGTMHPDLANMFEEAVADGERFVRAKHG